MPQRKRKPTPQEPGGAAVLVLIFAVLIVLALLVRLVTGWISSACRAMISAPRTRPAMAPLAAASVPEKLV